MILFTFIFPEGLKARGSRLHVAVDDGMAMDYDDGHMDWADDGQQAMMQQQGSAARGVQVRGLTTFQNCSESS